MHHCTIKGMQQPTRDNYTSCGPNNINNYYYNNNNVVNETLSISKLIDSLDQSF